ncbi:hypothetical protein [Gillisia sp. Hel_I_29]|uniref:hypothetical protein n=1 Tax=Gillisia sp. Hel_I_29 TaxID=1249975 RepID=UPI000558BD64|nr:hypothetical protein [Gillisia sp. Hel_I_29]
MIKLTKENQNNRLKELSEEKGIDFNSLKLLIDSVKTKKLFKRNNYHFQKINDTIEKATK